MLQNLRMIDDNIIVTVPYCTELEGDTSTTLYIYIYYIYNIYYITLKNGIRTSIWIVPYGSLTAVITIIRRLQHSMVKLERAVMRSIP